MKIEEFMEMMMDTNEKLNGLEKLKNKIMFAENDLKQLKNMPESVQDLLETYENYIRIFESFDDSE